MPKHKTGSMEWLEEDLWGRWEVIRRHKPYRDFCDRNSSSFDDSGVLITCDSKLIAESEVIMERYGLTAIVHHTEDDPPPFKRETSMEYIYNEVRSKEGMVLHSLFDDGHHVKGKDFTTVYPVWDGHYIKLKVDIGRNIPKGQLADEFTEFVERARELADIQPQKGKASKVDEETLKVWDLHAAGKKPKEIIKELWFKEYKKCPQSDDNKDKKFKELVQLYKSQGCEDYDDRAHDEAYGNPDEKGIRMRSLYKRLSDHLKDMESFFDLYTKG